MKNWLYQPAVALLIGGLCFSACKKGDNDKTNTEKISLAAWKYDKAEIDINKDGTGDLPVPDSQIEPCEKDNLITFKADGTGTIDEGATKCDQSDPQSMPFTWTFKTNETVINFPTAIVAGVDGDVTLVSLSETAMVLKKEVDGFPVIIAPTGKATVILTLKH
jgi:lipocalin-like protein